MIECPSTKTKDDSGGPAARVTYVEALGQNDLCCRRAEAGLSGREAICSGRRISRDARVDMHADGPTEARDEEGATTAITFGRYRETRTEPRNEPETTLTNADRDRDGRVSVQDEDEGGKKGGRTEKGEGREGGREGKEGKKKEEEEVGEKNKRVAQKGRRLEANHSMAGKLPWIRRSRA